MAGERRSPGPAPQAEKRACWAALIAQGVSNSEACRRAGVHRKTGVRWRHGRTVRDHVGREHHYPPVQVIERQLRSERYLSAQERIRIADLRRAGATVRGIARELGRSPSTVSREIRRNVDEQGRYRPHAAEQAAVQRMLRPRQRRVSADSVLRETVCGLLGKRWSPEQVAHELRVRFPSEPCRRLCTESIYQAIYDPAVDVSRPSRRRRHQRRRRGDCRQERVNGMTMIDQRPAEVEGRKVAGHWEGDLIKGAANRSAIGTLIERKTRFVVLLHLGGEQGAQALSAALERKLSALPAPLRRTITWDHGTEMARHKQTAQQTGAGVFFCDAHSPWERGSNENMNGLLRDYFPKGTDLSAHSAEDLERVAVEVNQRPRKTLGWSTPAQLLDAELGRSPHSPTVRSSPVLTINCCDVR
jgi:transposase, IS30 family